MPGIPWTSIESLPPLSHGLLPRMPVMRFMTLPSPLWPFFLTLLHMQRCYFQIRSYSQAPEITTWMYLLGRHHLTHCSEHGGWVQTPWGFWSLLAVYLQVVTKMYKQKPRQTALLLHCCASQGFLLHTSTAPVLLSLCKKSLVMGCRDIYISPFLTIPPETASSAGWGLMCIISRTHMRVGGLTFPEPFSPRRADKGLIICGDEKDTDEEILIQAKCSFFLSYVQIMQHNCFSMINIISGA